MNKSVLSIPQPDRAVYIGLAICHLINDTALSSLLASLAEAIVYQASLLRKERWISVMIIRFYKIKDTVTGLYSSGGSYPTWSDKGKQWSKRGFAINHMANAVGYRTAEEVYKNAELVEFEYEYNPVAVSTTKLIDIINEKNKKIALAAEQRKALYNKQKYNEAKAVIEQYETRKVLPMT